VSLNIRKIGNIQFVRLSMANKSTYQLAHEPDVAWIIALWKAIHGGDPSPEATADESSALMAAALASHLEEIEGASTKTSFERVQKGLGKPRGHRATGRAHRTHPPARHPVLLQVRGPDDLRGPAPHRAPGRVAGRRNRCRHQCRLVPASPRSAG
jgi:hypothetical protein